MPKRIVQDGWNLIQVSPSGIVCDNGSLPFPKSDAVRLAAKILEAYTDITPMDLMKMHNRELARRGKNTFDQFAIYEPERFE